MNTFLIYLYLILLLYIETNHCLYKHDILFLAHYNCQVFKIFLIFFFFFKLIKLDCAQINCTIHNIILSRNFLKASRVAACMHVVLIFACTMCLLCFLSLTGCFVSGCFKRRGKLKMIIYYSSLC